MNNQIQIIELHPSKTKNIKQEVEKVLTVLEVLHERYSRNHELAKILRLYQDNGSYWVAFKDAKPIGTVSIKEINKNVARIQRMFVLTEFHGTGVGKKLLEQAIQFAKLNKFLEIILTTKHEMKRAHRFYEKNGFVKIEDGQKTYKYKLKI